MKSVSLRSAIVCAGALSLCVVASAASKVMRFEERCLSKDAVVVAKGVSLDRLEDQPTGRRGKWDEVRLGGIGETDCAIGARILRLSARGGAFLDLGRRVCACA